MQVNSPDSSKILVKADEDIEKIIKEEDTILLMGAPNVGKSVFFSKMTGVLVTSSNYAGTTVTYTHGNSKIDDSSFKMIDVPGTYSLEANNEAEKIATSFLDMKPTGVVFVLNAADLEGSIKLLLEVLKHDVPVVAALNLKDVALRLGKEVDVKILEQHLGIKIVPTVAVKEYGFDELKKQIKDNLLNPAENKIKTAADLSNRELWKKASEINDAAVTYTSKKASRLDRFGNALVKPWPGFLISFLIIALSLGIVVFAGKALRAAVLLPLVNGVIVPFFENLFSGLAKYEMLHDILIGEYGVFRISFEWIITLILPYVTLFQFVFTFLEDSGVLPRMAVLFDSYMSKIGVQGGSLISLMLSLGCAVPAIISTRTASTRKERLIITTIICFTIPCMSQTGALIALFGAAAWWVPLALLATVIFLIIIISKFTSKILKGHVSPMVMEIPYILVPDRKSFLKKFWVRFKQFLIEAEGPMLIAVAFASVLVGTKALDPISKFLEPVVSGWLGMPEETTLGLILGVIRREMSVAPFIKANLTDLQMFIAGVISLLYIPCLSVFGILASEFNARVSVAIAITTTTFSIFFGGLINQVAKLIGAIL